MCLLDSIKHQFFLLFLTHCFRFFPFWFSNVFFSLYFCFEITIFVLYIFKETKSHKFEKRKEIKSKSSHRHTLFSLNSDTLNQIQIFFSLKLKIHQPNFSTWLLGKKKNFCFCQKQIRTKNKQTHNALLQFISLKNETEEEKKTTF